MTDTRTDGQVVRDALTNARQPMTTMQDVRNLLNTTTAALTALDRMVARIAELEGKVAQKQVPVNPREGTQANPHPWMQHKR